MEQAQRQDVILSADTSLSAPRHLREGICPRKQDRCQRSFRDLCANRILLPCRRTTVNGLPSAERINGWHFGVTLFPRRWAGRVTFTY